MDDFYWRRVEQKKKGYMDLYKEVLNDVFGREISWSEFKGADSDKQISVMVQLDHKIKLKESPIDVKKMAMAIQDSRSGIGGCAFTKFECAFCGKEESWSNTAVPRICKECATKMATQIAMYHYDILK